MNYIDNACMHKCFRNSTIYKVFQISVRPNMLYFLNAGVQGYQIRHSLEGHKGHEGQEVHEDICISLTFSDFLCIFLHISAFLYISLHFFTFLYISLHFSTFIYILHFLFKDNLTERTVVLWTPFLIYFHFYEIVRSFRDILVTEKGLEKEVRPMKQCFAVLKTDLYGSQSLEEQFLGSEHLIC